MKNNILAIETTSKICGVSIISNNKILYEKNLNNGYNHSVTLFDTIDKVLKHCKIDFKNIDKIKVSSGPGSFTGIRIGIAAAIGLSKAYGTPIEYVDTLDALCYKIKSKNDYIISMIDAKNDRIYMSIYESKKLKKIFNDSIFYINDLVDLLNKYFTNKNICFSFVGDGAISYKEIFNEHLNINYTIYDSFSSLKASYTAFTDGKISKIPIINYLIQSKAEQERYDSNNICKK